jgi:hypothetical protein
VRGAAVLAAVEVGLGEQVPITPHVERVVVGDGRADVRDAAERRPGLGRARAEAAAEAGPAAAVEVQEAAPGCGGARRGRGVHHRRRGRRRVGLDSDEQLGRPFGGGVEAALAELAGGGSELDAVGFVGGSHWFGRGGWGWPPSSRSAPEDGRSASFFLNFCEGGRKERNRLGTGGMEFGRVPLCQPAHGRFGRGPCRAAASAVGARGGRSGGGGAAAAAARRRLCNYAIGLPNQLFLLKPYKIK